MALSNWDTLALDHEGKPCSGVFTTPLGIQAELYKNWLYVRDKAGWSKGGAFVEPVVMQLNEGDCRYKDLVIRASRGPQEGIYLAVWSGHDYKGSKSPFSGMLGIGCYGFRGEEWVGAEDASVSFFQSLLQGLGKYEIPETLLTLDFGQAARFNQGDAFFAKRLGTDLPTSAPGKAEDPILIQALRKE